MPVHEIEQARKQPDVNDQKEPMKQDRPWNWRAKSERDQWDRAEEKPETKRHGVAEGENEPKQDQEKGNDQDKANQEKDKQEEKPKPPIGVRIRLFVLRHPVGTVIGIILLILAAIAAALLLRYFQSYESTDDAQVDGHLNSIGTRVGGTVAAVHFENNQYVKEGDVLAELDPRDFKVAVEQAQANWAQAHAQIRAQRPAIPITQTTSESDVAASRAEVTTAEAAVAAAERDHQASLAQIRQAEAQAIQAQSDVARYRGLVERDEISRQQFDSAVATAKSQTAAVDAARAAAEAANRTVAQREAQLQQAQTRMRQAAANAPHQIATQQAELETRDAALQGSQAGLDQAKLNLSYTKIIAPISGVVAHRAIEIGQRVEPGQQLFMIGQIDDLWVTANFKETQLRNMRTGQQVEFTVDAFGGRKYRGYVQDMPGATGAVIALIPPENATGNFVKVVQRLPVRIALNPGENDDHLLRIGMSVVPRVWIHPNWLRWDRDNVNNAEPRPWHPVGQ